MAPSAPTTTAVATVLPTAEARVAVRPLSATDIRLAGGFWAERAAINRDRTIPAGFEQLHAAGTIHNFRLAAGAGAAGERYRALGIMFDKPFPFLDSDVYKWLEGVAWELGHGPDPRLAVMADEAIGAIEAAQASDGYLNTFVQVLAPGTAYRDLEWGHELYCYGHLIQAAIAWHRALGDDRLLLVAERAVASVERELGPGRREAIDGHPEIEMGLVELYRVTGERRHLELAATFIERRGQGILGDRRFGRGYWQDHLPVREAPEVVGHAVRQLYLDAGAVDVAVELGEAALLDAVVRRWEDMVATRMYLTGALGSRHKDEAFGAPYELPPDRAYAETCAAIASVMLAWRLLQATGRSVFADVIERTTYNAVLPALSRDGTAFFYVNPLQRRTHQGWTEPGTGERAAWYACACCPPNLMRFIASWPQLIATTDDGGLRVHQYAAAEVAATVDGDGRVRLAIDTAYPWAGHVRLTILETPASPWALDLRIPGWCERATVRVGGAVVEESDATPAEGRRRLTRMWQAGDVVELDLDLPPRVTRPHPRVDAIRGCVALERGPLVYALESADLPAGIELEDVALPEHAGIDPEPRPDLGPSVLGLRTTGRGADGADVPLRPIPYFTWAGRGVGGMRVWIPSAPSVASTPAAERP